MDRQNDTHPLENPPDETILHLLDEHKALPTTSVAAAVDDSVEATESRLQKMAKVGLIDHCETPKGDVWLSW